MRELQNEVLRALALGDGSALDADLFSTRVRQSPSSTRGRSTPDAEGITLKDKLDQLEAQVIAETLRKHRGNKTRVAEELGLTRVGLRMKLARLGLTDSE